MAQVSREKVRIYALVPDTQEAGGITKYYIVGSGTASASISMNYANEENKTITKAMPDTSITKGAWNIQMTGKAETSDNVHNYITINSIRGETEKLVVNILVVFEYIHQRGKVGTVLALSGKASLPLTSIGGDGQAKIQIDATLTTSGDLTEGSIDLNACGLAGVYDPVKDTYETTSFKAGKIITNLDPYTKEDEKGTDGDTPAPEKEEPKNPQTEDEPVKENPEEQPQVKNSVFTEDDWASRDCEFKAYKDETNFIQFKVSSKQITPTGYFYGETPTALNEVPAGKKYNFKIVDGELKFVSDNVVNNIYEDEAKDKPVKCAKIELVNDTGQVENNEEV